MIVTQVVVSSWGTRSIDNDNKKELNRPQQYMPMIYTQKKGTLDENKQSRIMIKYKGARKIKIQEIMINNKDMKKRQRLTKRYE